MKRIVTAVVLLAVIIVAASYSLHDLKVNIGELNDACAAMQAKASTADEAEMAEDGRALLELWNKKEARFVLYIQHDNLDHLTQEFSQLAELGRYGDRAQYYAKLDSILSLLDDIERSAVPGYRNLL